MQKVTGIGGFFFRSEEPETLARWYADNLGVDLVPSDYGSKAWTTEAGVTVFAPFPKTTAMFGDDAKQWMINFRVTDLDAMAAQLRTAGTEVDIDPEVYPNGRFASCKDPEGNPIQLWQPI